MKKTNWFKIFVRLWIGLTSLAAFIGGWIFLGHSGKPVSAASLNAQDAAGQVQSLQPLPTLEPLPSLDSGSTVQQFSNQPSFQQNFNFTPRFRTRGS